MRRLIHEILESGVGRDAIAVALNSFMIVLILLNVIDRSDCKLLRLDRRDFERLMHRRPELLAIICCVAQARAKASRQAEHKPVSSRCDEGAQTAPCTW